MSRAPSAAAAAALLSVALLAAAASAALVTDGLVLHLDAAAANVVTGGTGPAGLPRVSQWNDSAALGGLTHAAQGTLLAQPEYWASVPALNNQPALRFYGDSGEPLPGANDGVLDFMDINGIGASFSTAATIFVVARPESPLQGNLGITVYDTGSGDSWWNFSGTSGYSALFRTPRYEGTIPIGGAALSGSHIFEIGSGANYDWFEGGVLDGTSSAGTFHTGANHRIGNAFANPGIGKAYEGFVAEILIYDRLLSYYERQDVGDYLAVKYGIATMYLPEPGALALLAAALALAVRRRRDR
jgi:hypothetical protein